MKTKSLLFLLVFPLMCILGVPPSNAGLTLIQSFVEQNITGNTKFGISVSGAGDVNGDGNSEVIIGTVGYPVNGKAFIYGEVFVPVPEIDVRRPAETSIVDGGSDNVGNQLVGTVTLIYAIDNRAGTAQLDITSVIAENLINCSGFSVVTNLPLNIAAGATANLQVLFTVDAVGAFSLDMDMINDDADENPYDIQVNGNGMPLKAIVLVSFSAEVSQAGVYITWTTETEANNAGFNIYRSQQEDGEYIKINDTIITAQGDDTTGAEYSLTDMPEQSGTYYYKLQDVNINGQTRFHGPIQVAGVTSVEDESAINPGKYQLFQNHPNPFNPNTEIRFTIPNAGHVSIKIYDMNGKLVKNLVSEQKAAGVYSISWDGQDKNGFKVTSGVYFYRINAGEFTMSKKMILMK